METTLNESNIYSQLLPVNYRDGEKEIENDFILGRKVMNYVGTINLKHIWGEENWKKSIFLSRQTNKDFPRMIILVTVLRMGIYVLSAMGKTLQTLRAYHPSYTYIRSM